MSGLNFLMLFILYYTGPDTPLKNGRVEHRTVLSNSPIFMGKETDEKKGEMYV